jgi:Ca2+-binding EF-hand superfamily protein
MELVQGAQHAYGPSIAAQKEIEALRKVFVTIDTDRDGRISEAELNKVLAKLDYRPRKGEVADMIWEVDEDCDRHVSWAEFELMFIRCRSDMVRQRAKCPLRPPLSPSPRPP